MASLREYLIDNSQTLYNVDSGTSFGLPDDSDKVSTDAGDDSIDWSFGDEAQEITLTIDVWSAPALGDHFWIPVDQTAWTVDTHLMEREDVILVKVIAD